MKKLLVTTLTIGMISFMSISASAAGSATSSNFKCPNGNEICTNSKTCLNDGQFTSYQKCFRINPVTGQSTKASTSQSTKASTGQSTKSSTAQSTQASTTQVQTSDSSSYVCPNGNTACNNNGACINNGECQNQNNCTNNGIAKQDGTGHQGGGQNRGHHGGNRGR